MLLDNKLGVQHNEGGARVVIEEFPARRRSQLHRHGRRQNAWPSWPPARITSACSMATKAPNTGGMGAYSPAPVVTPNVHAKAMQEIILPTLAGMAKDGSPFTGFPMPA